MAATATFQLQPEEDHARAEDVKQQHAQGLGQTEPLLKHIGGTGEEGADVEDHRKPQQREGRPGEDGLELAGEHLPVEAGDELRAVVVVAQLRDDEMQQQIEEIAEAENQQGLPQTVVGSQIGHRQDPRADAVADDDAGRLPEAEASLGLARFHRRKLLEKWCNNSIKALPGLVNRAKKRCEKIDFHRFFKNKVYNARCMNMCMRSLK